MGCKIQLKTKICGFEDNGNDPEIQMNLLKKMIEVLTDNKHKSNVEDCDYCNRTMSEALLNVAFNNTQQRIEKSMFSKICLTLSSDLALLSSLSEQSKTNKEKSQQVTRDFDYNQPFRIDDATTTFSFESDSSSDNEDFSPLNSHLIQDIGKKWTALTVLMFFRSGFLDKEKRNLKNRVQLGLMVLRKSLNMLAVFQEFVTDQSQLVKMVRDFRGIEDLIDY